MPTAFSRFDMHTSINEINTSPLQDDHGSESNSPNRATQSDSPEALTRTDTRWINTLRILLNATLVVVAIVISVAVYEIASKTETKIFESEFEKTSSRMKQLFLQDLSLKLWIAHMAVYSLQLNASGAGFADINMQFLQDLFLAEAITYWDSIVWSPLLRTEAERNNWEDYVNHSRKRNQSGSAVCHVCGEGMEVGNQDNIVNVPGVGGIPCNVVERAGRSGMIPEVGCALINTIIGPCKCQPAAASSSNNLVMNTTQSQLASNIFGIKDDKKVVKKRAPYSPVGKVAPALADHAIFYDQLSNPIRRPALLAMIDSKLPTFTQTSYPRGGYEKLLNELSDTPMGTVFFPVFGQPPNDNDVIGSMAIDFRWSSIFGYGEKVPFNSHGIVLVLESNHGQAFTYEITQNLTASLISVGDVHDVQFDSMMNATTFQDCHNVILRAASTANIPLNQSSLLYKISVFPSATFKSQFVTNKPAIYAAIVAAIFVFTSAIFYMYDIFVRRRQSKVMQSAIQANAIVTSLFPDSIRSRLMSRIVPRSVRQKVTKKDTDTPKQQLLAVLRGLKQRSSENLLLDNDSSSEPIAEYFPNTTVIFADIAGFTAWSSERQPRQVFQLLETVYREFDRIAEKHGVFKVETIGDCYVAVTGLPEPQADHAVRMARFSQEIMESMHQLVGPLESTLGPGTGDLSIRVGLHSGPVTGGVLRGDKARFQLFGDTMNTAARMQTTGEVRMIQTTTSTASLLNEAGYSHWLQERDTKVAVKGKGEMQTFWIDLPSHDTSSLSSRTSEDLTISRIADYLSSFISDETRRARANSAQIDPINNEKSLGQNGPGGGKLKRLVSCNARMLERFLKVVAARRSNPVCTKCGQYGVDSPSIQRYPIEELSEFISMPEYCETSEKDYFQAETIELSDTVRFELHEYVETVARKYRDHPFHNFEHATHVVMSVNKFVNHVIKQDDMKHHQLQERQGTIATRQQAYHTTYGISSDALMQFALLFSALIHDVDHQGVPNVRLAQEGHEIATRYNHRSVAEQHSVWTAWDLLMEDRFESLRGAIFASHDEQRRFRQLVVNAVIATDIADAELQLMRKNMWNRAFDGTDGAKLSNQDAISRKATVVFEYMIQASDVAHTVQGWHVYCKWNERLFHELSIAYRAGRGEVDPSVGWYQGEINFFDNYVVPLAQKLETCGVLGAVSKDYLANALKNRHEWERTGRKLVQSWKEKYSTSQPETDLLSEDNNKEAFVWC